MISQCFQITHRMRRREFAIAPLALVIASITPLSATSISWGSELDPAVRIYRQRQDQATPASVLAWLQTSNRRFTDGKSIHGGYSRDARERVRVSAQGQRPLAAVLSCIDSRTSPEIVFDTAVGDLFTARVGANVVNDDVLGSLEIAVASGAKVIVVLGHTDCGGIKGACGGLQYGHMTQLLERVKPAIAETHATLDKNPALSFEVGERIVSNPRFIAEVSHAHARMSTQQIRDRSPILREQLARGEVILVTAVYDVKSGRVKFDKVISE